MITSTIKIEPRYYGYAANGVHAATFTIILVKS